MKTEIIWFFFDFQIKKKISNLNDADGTEVLCNIFFISLWANSTEENCVLLDDQVIIATIESACSHENWKQEEYVNLLDFTTCRTIDADAFFYRHFITN